MDTEIKKEVKQEKTKTENITPPTTAAMPRKTFLLILVLAVIAVGLLAVSLLPNNANKNLTNNTAAIPDPVQTTLEISTPEVITTSATSYSADIVIDTKEAADASGVQLELSYDPAALTNVEIKPGDFFDNPNVLIKKIDTINGKITYALFKPEGKTGTGIVAVLNFTKLGKATTKIDVLPKTQVSAVGLAQSILKSSRGIEF